MWCWQLNLGLPTCRQAAYQLACVVGLGNLNKGWDAVKERDRVMLLGSKCKHKSWKLQENSPMEELQSDKGCLVCKEHWVSRLLVPVSAYSVAFPRVVLSKLPWAKRA